MAATFQFSESNLAGEVETIPISNLNFGSIDEADIVTATNPVIRGTNSFEKYIRGKFTGSWTEISNIKFWKSAGAYVTGESLKAAANVSYATPSQTANADSDIPTTEGTALGVNSAEGASSIIYGDSGVSGYTAYIRLQARITAGATVGAGNQKTFILQYDEV